jgi:hypothetical protein
MFFTHTTLFISVYSNRPHFKGTEDRERVLLMLRIESHYNHPHALKEIKHIMDILELVDIWRLNQVRCLDYLKLM